MDSDENARNPARAGAAAGGGSPVFLDWPPMAPEPPPHADPHPEIDRILIDRTRIASRVAELGTQIASDAELDRGADRLVVVPVLTGALVFAADLVRSMPMRLRLELIQASSYPGTATKSQGVTLGGGPTDELKDAHVLIVDDIFDSGRTLAAVKRLVQATGPASVRTAVLLRKEVERAPDLPPQSEPDYVGFDVPDAFVVGYGLDYDGWYRNLPNIAVLRA